jgi:hypothetical protein
MERGTLGKTRLGVDQGGERSEGRRSAQRVPKIMRAVGSWEEGQLQGQGQEQRERTKRGVDQGGERNEGRRNSQQVQKLMWAVEKKEEDEQQKGCLAGTEAALLPPS